MVKIIQGLFHLSKSTRRRRYNNASAEKPRLEAEIASIRSSADQKIQEQHKKEDRERELIVYAEFFESIGSVSTSEVRAQESARVDQHKAVVARTEKKSTG